MVPFALGDCATTQLRSKEPMSQPTVEPSASQTQVSTPTITFSYKYSIPENYRH